MCLFNFNANFTCLFRSTNKYIITCNNSFLISFQQWLQRMNCKCEGLAHHYDLLKHEGSLSSCLTQLPAQLIVLILQSTVPFQQLSNILCWLWPVTEGLSNCCGLLLCVIGTLGCIYLTSWQDNGLLENVCLTQRALELLLHGHEVASPAVPEPKQVYESRHLLHFKCRRCVSYTFSPINLWYLS